MVLSLGTADLCIVGGYLILALWIGMVQSRKIKNMRDYAVADRQFTVPLLVATISATLIGGGSTLGLTEKIVSSGVVFLIATCGTPFCKLIMAQFIAPRMGQFRECISVGDIMERYYGQVGRVVTGISGTLLMVGLMGAQISAMGNLFHYFLGISHFWGAFIGYSIVIVYSAFGGIRAVTLTDMMQFGVLMIAIPMACNVGLNIVGGYGALFAAVPTERLFADSGNLVGYLFLFVVFVIPFLDPSITQRLLMARNSEELAKAMRVSAAIDVPFYMIVVFIGLLILVLAPDVAPSIAFPYFIDHFMPTGVKGLVIAGLLAVIMSTVDSDVNSASVTFVHDVLKPLFPRHMNDRRELILAKVATCILGIFAFMIATRFRVIRDIVLLSLNFWGPVVVVPLYAVIFSIKASSRSFIAGAAAGTLTVIGWLFFDLEKHLGFDGLIPGMVLNTLFFFSTRTASERQTKIPECIESKRNISWCNQIKREYGGFWGWLTYSANSEVMDRKQYIVFGIFSVINYIVPYFMWAPSNHFSAALFLRLFGGILSFLLIIKDYWPQYMKKYLYLYSIFTIFYCLPFLTSYMLIENNGSVMWLLNTCLGIFLLSVMLNWVNFFITLLTGVFSGILLHVFVSGPIFLKINSETLFQIGYMYVFSVIIGVVFSRSRETFQAEKIDAMKAVAGSIAHEMRTPLATIRMGAETLKNKLPLYIDAYDTAVGAGISVPAVNHDGILKTIDRFGMVTNQASFIIDMLLMKLKNVPSEKQLISLSMKGCVEGAVDTYPLSPDQRAMISVDCSHDFTFQGHGESFTYVVYNLLKNALYHLGRKAGSGTILIKTGMTKEAHILSITDTGPGIPSDQMPYIFDPFYSRTQHGTGLGLSFCRAVLTRFGGTIGCESVLGKSTTFILTFPKEQRGATIPQ